MTTMKVLLGIGWTCFALDAAFIMYLFIAQNAGDDAAGRGVATGYGIVLLPILLLFGGVLWWGMRHHSLGAVITGVILVSLPFIIAATLAISSKIKGVRYAADQARDGRFKNPAIKQIVAAIDAKDTANLRALLAASKSLDYRERDAAGHTLLGFAVTRASDYLSTPDKTEALRILFKSGVPYAADALEPNGDWVRDLVVSSGRRQNEIVEMALAAGANANAQDRYTKKAMIFSYDIPPSRLKILTKHGADLQVFDEKGWTLLMNAVYFKKWDSALYFLQHNVPVAYTAPDSNTVRTLLAEVAKPSNNREPLGSDYDAFVAALDAKERSSQAAGVGRPGH